MPDFSKLTNTPAGKAVKPKALPVGPYPGVVKSFEFLAAPEGKNYESIIRFHLALQDWPEGVAEEDKQQPQPDGTSTPIDLAKRQLRRDFYDNSLAFLDDFIRSCGIDMNGRNYGEVLPEVVGAPVTVSVQQYLNERTSEMGNNVGDIVGTAG